jgi:hypothetical protein
MEDCFENTCQNRKYGFCKVRGNRTFRHSLIGVSSKKGYNEYKGLQEPIPYKPIQRKDSS